MFLCFEHVSTLFSFFDLQLKLSQIITFVSYILRGKVFSFQSHYNTYTFLNI